MPKMDHRAAVALTAILLLPALAGCLQWGPPDGSCDAWGLIQDGTASFNPLAHPDGGIAPRPGAEADPRVTAWVLIALRLAERAGLVGEFDPRPHTDYLVEALPGMQHEGTGVDSVANNLSLVRAALQSWGRSAWAIPLDPAVPAGQSLADAWQERYDEQTGIYGERVNEHLFAGFAARLFESDHARLAAMAAALNGTLRPAAEMDALYDQDAWYAGHARALLGPRPWNQTLAVHLDLLLEDRQDENGGFRPGADGAPDASTTAAALLAWQATGRTHADRDVGLAVDYLCSLKRSSGAIPFSADVPVMHAKTTAEVVIALSLIAEPIPWPEPPPDPIAT